MGFNALNLKIPPPLVGLIVGFLIFLANHYWPSFKIDSAAIKYVSTLFFAIGLLIEGWSVALFFRARTTVNPLKPEKSKALVTTGLYRFTRNPMYLGMLMLLIGWAFRLGNPLGFPMLIVFVWYLTRFQIKPEELALEKIFENQYSDYKQKVNRWL